MSSVRASHSRAKVSRGTASYTIPLKTLDGVVRRGEIAPLRIGKKVLFPKPQVEEFLTGVRST